MVNNAGITKDTLLLRMKEEDFDSVIDVNLKGVFNCLKTITPIMVKQKYGKIVNLSSVVGIIGNAGQVNYAASKAGVIGMTKSLAKEIGARGITVNAVAPGFIETDMTDGLGDKLKEEAKKGIPLRRLGTAADVAEVVAFLSSESSNYITGQVINVDGGMVM
jgi:3-oxoacyl-[acyl-carrier protein] reductase